MKLRLSLPDTFKFIKIVLTVKHLIFKTEIRILIKLGHLILPDSKLIKNNSLLRSLIAPRYPLEFLSVH